MKLIFVAIVTALLLTPTVHASATTTSSATKLWTTDLSAFLSERPGNWIVGHSTEPALSANEAETFARRDAAGPLFDKLRLRLPRSSWPALQKRIGATLAAGDWVVDRQVESDVRPYGTIWRAAVLIDATPERTNRLVRDVERETRQERERAAAGTAGAMVIALAVGSVYLMLNWLTRGFFRGRLLTASILILTTGILGIVHLL
jgi:hypothetical protein